MNPKDIVVVVGKESSGKTSLISSLTGKTADSANIRGTTVHCDVFDGPKYRFMDTPGILLKGDTQTTKLALQSLDDAAKVVLVVRATSIDKDLEDLLPLVSGKAGLVIVTFWDRYEGDDTVFHRLETLGLRAIGVDSRNVDEESEQTILRILEAETVFPESKYRSQGFWHHTPGKSVFDRPILGRALALTLLFLPAAAAVSGANSLADFVYDPVSSVFAPLIDKINTFPTPLNFFFGGDYGIVAMFPFLLLYALPTIVFFAFFLGVYKASGLLDRISSTVHPLLAPLGLGGRDLVRVIMGFGCNVPAVINSRACSVTTRRACVSAICFGSACSYQLPATLAVFSAVGMSYLTLPFLLLLTVTTLVYLFLLRLNSKQTAQLGLLSCHSLLVWPRFQDAWAEVRGVLRQFFTLALPVFLLICIVASLLAWTGFLDILTSLIAPVMKVFRLPPEASPAVILGSVRKDGIAIGLLNSDWTSFKAGSLTPLQTLTTVFLAGTFLPCLVTMWTVRKEFGLRQTFLLALRQGSFSLLITLLVAWGGSLLF